MGPRIVAFGDNVVDCYTEQGLMFPGGNALNVAVHTRRFGGRSVYIGAVGDDVAGHHIRDSLVSEDVDVANLRMGEGSTAFCLIGHEDGDRLFLGADLGVSIIRPNVNDLERIADADAVHTGRSSHMEPWLPEFSRRTRVSFDFAVMRDRDRIGRLAPHCFLASFSGGGLSTREAEDLARSVHEAGSAWVLVTLGAEGAILLGANGLVRAAPVSTAVLDTLGAGDTFIARTLLGLLIGQEPEDLVAAASLAATRTCGHLGGFGYPAPIDVDLSRARPLSEIYGTGNSRHDVKPSP